MPFYAESPTWADIQPLHQDDGGPDALATIAYTEEYKEALSYLRAIMAVEEFTERVMQLTEHVISMNPAHYTVWLYRARTLVELNASIEDELTWLNHVALAHIKNYQIWHHRQLLLTRLAPHDLDFRYPALSKIIRSEIDFLNAMLDKDAKNYHVWSYRQWLVRKFGLWDDSPENDKSGHTALDELEETSRWLRRDIRNNSAWNHRFFVVFGNKQQKIHSDYVYDREVQYAQDAINLCPQNESSWKYLRAVLKRSGRSLNCIEVFAKTFARLNDNRTSPTYSLEEQEIGEQDMKLGQKDEYEDTCFDDTIEQIRSSFALDVLAETYSRQSGREEHAIQALELLRDKFDPIRANYWDWRLSQVATRSSFGHK